MQGGCGLGAPNSGSATSRSYDCKKPEASTILRTNCGGTLVSQQWRCQAICAERAKQVPLALEDELASDEVWNNYFGFTSKTEIDGSVTETPLVNRQQGKAALDYSPACSEVWTLGHGRYATRSNRFAALCRIAA